MVGELPTSFHPGRLRLTKAGFVLSLQHTRQDKGELCIGRFHIRMGPYRHNLHPACIATQASWNLAELRYFKQEWNGGIISLSIVCDARDRNSRGWITRVNNRSTHTVPIQLLPHEPVSNTHQHGREHDDGESLRYQSYNRLPGLQVPSYFKPSNYSG